MGVAESSACNGAKRLLVPPERYLDRSIRFWVPLDSGMAATPEVLLRVFVRGLCSGFSVMCMFWAKQRTYKSKFIFQLKALEKAVEDTIESIWKCMTQAHDLGQHGPEYLKQSQSSLKENLDELISKVVKVDTTSRKVDDLVPVEVIHRSDRGQNPDEVTQKYLEDVLLKNSEARARILGAHSLEESLKTHLQMWEQTEDT
eukprot:1071862-Amorphochlora_amoeboformis.AAC.2